MIDARIDTQSAYLFFNDMNFQKIKINRFHKIVLVETGLAMALKFSDGGVQPDRFAQIKFIADLVKSLENLVGPGIFAVICDDGVSEKVIVFYNFKPNAHDRVLS